jgi:hypothetical protein
VKLALAASLLFALSVLALMLPALVLWLSE